MNYHRAIRSINRTLDLSEEMDFLEWRHNGSDGVSNHQPHDCSFYRLFRLRWKKTSMLRITGLCEGDLPVTGDFPAQRASNAKNDSIWWRHHDLLIPFSFCDIEKWPVSYQCWGRIQKLYRWLCARLQYFQWVHYQWKHYSLAISQWYYVLHRYLVII